MAADVTVEHEQLGLLGDHCGGPVEGGIELGAPTNVQFEVPGFSEGFQDWPVAGFDRVLAERGPPGLTDWDEARFPKEADV